MSAFVADYRKLLQFALTLGAALIVLAATQFKARADADQHMLIIPASDGYGFDDCLGTSKSCGKVIADAWCEAHGLSASVSFGRSDDVTATTKGVPSPQLEPGSFIVYCGDAKP